MIYDGVEITSENDIQNKTMLITVWFITMTAICALWYHDKKGWYVCITQPQYVEN